MPPEVSPRPTHRARRIRAVAVAVAAVAAIAAGLVPGPLARADDEAPAAWDPASSVRSPLASERRAAERAMIAQGAAALPRVRAWAKHADARLRTAAWHVLAVTGTEADLGSAVRALADRQPAVARAVAEAVVRLATRLPPADEPWLPGGRLGREGQRSLAAALAGALERAAPNEVPVCLFRLGEGVVPSLHFLAAEARFDRALRERAMHAMARVGGDAARRALASLPQCHDPRGRGAWWRELSEVGPGPELARAHAFAVEYARKKLRTTYNRGAMWREWRDEQEYLRFLASCPPADDLDVVADFVRLRLFESAQRRYRKIPSLVTAIVRALLVVSEPTDESLSYATELALPGWRGAGRRGEELGGVLALLAPYKAREGVREGLEEVLWEDDLPASVRAWALYLRGDEKRADIAARATSLIRADGDAATMAQRRLGVQLWEQLGDPPPDLIRELLADLDPFVRATAIRWAAKRAGTLPEGEWAAAVRRGLADEDESVLLLAAENTPDALGDAVAIRLLELAVRGRRALRGRAWRVLGRQGEASSASTEDAFDPPPAAAGLDERIRAAARLRAPGGG